MWSAVPSSRSKVLKVLREVNHQFWVLSFFQQVCFFSCCCSYWWCACCISCCFWLYIFMLPSFLLAGMNIEITEAAALTAAPQEKGIYIYTYMLCYALNVLLIYTRTYTLIAKREDKTTCLSGNWTTTTTGSCYRATTHDVWLPKVCLRMS